MPSEDNTGAGRWTTLWLAIRFTGGEDRQVTFLRWYVGVEHDLAVLLPGDDPVLPHLDSDEMVEVAPVRRRGQVRDGYDFVPATLRVGDADVAGRVAVELDRKYRWRHRLFRPASWLVRQLGGPDRGKSDVAVTVEVQGVD